MGTSLQFEGYVRICVGFGKQPNTFMLFNVICEKATKLRKQRDKLKKKERHENWHIGSRKKVKCRFGDFLFNSNE